MDNQEVLYNAYFTATSIESILIKVCGYSSYSDNTGMPSLLSIQAGDIRQHPFNCIQKGIACLMMDDKKREERLENAKSFLAKYESELSLEELYDKNGEEYLKTLVEDLQKLVDWRIEE